ncbi:MAG TPA: peptide ABC transporter substrate-binding protein [Lysinibacillus sp.]|jgi:oligopeptide transport system substrate-binding protein|uniref:Peptide ABC transporter substrate-binding protein n=2 Tax=Lysinibacillus TaxID=400634 RepID=A0A2I0UV53_9BACI|nr:MULTISPECIES: peptide ABC transporter substrate-binding protein [Lysinibacillus]HBT73273.1 peptide ABC transporter substrate-binding protein [Lysinibacillus sp.]KUF36061.1 peptide ABC transporter substrate-binding protein [Lysinibacillus sp. F5]PKU49911.1 peptide ABC transporter substrate-binding protein [Lysinibacillus fusiformis]SCY97008.1 oligopeptide transport system substrate-binding protein [Lysinibacillus sp. SG9]SDB45925.1 oligopeptide transport system substrate-binding protein [Lys
MAKKTKWLVVLLGLMLIVLVGCYGKENNTSGNTTNSNESDNASTDEGDNTAAQELHLVATGDLTTMSSLGSVDALAVTAMNSVFEGLYRIGPENTPVPGMAESHEVSEDGTVYTFKIRKDAVWSNGSPVTAHDFEYAWKRAINPETQAIYSYLMLDIKNAANVQTEEDPLYGKVEEIGIKALNDETLEVQLNAPIPYFISLTTYAPFFPLNEEFTESQGDQYALEAANMIYNGPFQMESWQHGQGWTFVKNESYWDKDTVKLTKITQKIVKDTATAVNLYEAGEIDTAELSSEYVAQYKDSPEYSTFLKPNTYFIRINHENQYLANQNIRKAIDLAWDKQGFADVILQDGSIPAYYLVPQGLSTDDKGNDFRDGNGDMNKTDIELAKELWATGKKELGVDQVKLEFLTYDRAESKKAAEFIKNQLETNLEGLELTINMQPNKQKLALEGAVDFDLDYGGWGPDYQDPMTYIELFESTAYYNQSNYKNEKVDALIKQAKTTSDVIERWELMQQAEKLMMEDVAFAPTFQKGLSRLTKPYVKNLYEHPFSADISYKWVEIVN